MRSILWFAGVCVVFGLGAAYGAEKAATAPAEAETRPSAISRELLAKVQGDLKKVKTVEADFVEEKELSMLKHTLTIRGHFAMEQPDRLVWIVREPVRYAISVDGETVRQWDEETNRVDVIHLGNDVTFKAVSEQIQAWFLGDYEALGKSYELGVLGTKPLSLRFTPKADSMVAKIFKGVDVTFSEDGKYIEKMVMKESGGDKTTLTFLHAQVNQPIKDGVWRIPPNDR